MAKKLIFIFNYDKPEFEKSCWNFNEVAKFLNRDISSVYNSMRILKNKRQKDLVLKDKEGKKHLLILDKELLGKEWYK